LRAKQELVVAEDVEVEVENSDGFIHNVGTLACSLRARSSSDGLRRPRGLGSQIRE
jgi:hypothetical protein